MKQLLLATNNPAKIEEISYFLQDLPLELVTLKQKGVVEQSPEDGRTFLENAQTKARFYMEKTGLPSLADDGGIEIDALGGEPGVDSHRWVSKTHDDPDDVLIAHTLERLSHVPDDKRGAQMHLILALCLPNGTLFTTEGIVRGVIAKELSNNPKEGFPFRSLFFIPEIGKYYDHDVLTPKETEIYNHRKAALEKMKPILIKELV